LTHYVWFKMGVWKVNGHYSKSADFLVGTMTHRMDGFTGINSVGVDWQLFGPKAPRFANVVILECLKVIMNFVILYLAQLK